MATAGDVFLKLIFVMAEIYASTVFVDRLFGIPLDRKPLYDPSKNFKCLDGSASISFDWVNDDYCDCQDGSDEPGTAACPNGFFHCVNLAAESKNIHSSWVNDGICDCCDGSDEWLGRVKCPNICVEIGRKMREELERKQAIQREGNAIRNQLVKEAEQMKTEKKSKLEAAMAEREAIQASYDQARSKLNLIYNSIIKILKIRMKKLQKQRTKPEMLNYKHGMVKPKFFCMRIYIIFAEAKKLKKEEERKFKASAAFKTLDVNQDGKITTDEMQLRKEFDVDEDGVVSVEEANIFLGNETEVEVDHFISHIWDSIEHTYKSEVEEDSHDEEKPAAPAEESIAEIDSKLDYRDAEADDLDAKELLQDYENEESLEENIGKEEKEFNTDIFDSLPQEELPDDENISYSNETQRLIDLAQAARSEFYEIERKVSQLDSDIRDIEDLLNQDFGPEDAFLPLNKQCFEIKDAEYTYKLCLFKDVYQISLNGDHRVHLGNWGRWLEKTGGKLKQIYENGMSCWNGPTRSATVIIQCGIENSLLSSSEPSICEYVLTFQSPAACDTLPEHLNQEHEL
ncbi:Glucosidase 2 subunit beta [Trichinella pseudospiralis]|uniref:Glucosidase 2 subunit beta n=1 Tax=Trichinella pseudospiralis TaxID=6337 RepID=A0A0V1EVN8_TRIPS|nr:Glucosidase 2 subunit beta [Trichinella pseudospiralis]KRZ43948.1 Glucosidase 2 subunit beta [Trichinella pseudospiralis]